MDIRFGNRDMAFPGGDLGELRDSNGLLDDMPALQPAHSGRPFSLWWAVDGNGFVLNVLLQSCRNVKL